jgi:glycosyltransferase involved in cell wall biosynthesis
MTLRRLRPTPSAFDTNRRLRVLYLIDSLGPGGAERLLAAYLERLPELGVEPVVVALKEREGNPIAALIEANGVPVRRLGIRRMRERGAFRQVSEVVAETRPDVVHTQLELSNTLGTIAASRLGIPCLSTIHTLDRPTPWSRDAARFRLMAWVLRHRADLVIAVSRSARNHFLRTTRAPGELVTTIHNGIDIGGFSATSGNAEVRRDLGLDSEDLVATTVAVLRQPKGIDDMIDALPAIAAAVPSIRYLIVGDGEHGAALREHVAASGLSDRVIFAGARADVARILTASDIFVLPSHTEALPTVLIEAMAAGLPVVATEVGGIPEMVERGWSALLVPPHRPDLLADAVTRVLSSPLQASAMGKAGARLATERFDIERQVQRLVNEYRLLVTRGAA